MALDTAEAWVGRSVELAALRLALEAARRGEPQLVVIEAEAGMGKSALVRRFGAELAGATLLQAEGEESETSLDYAVVSQLVRCLPPQVAEGLPLLNSGPSATTDPFATGAELVQALGSLQGAGAVVAIVDDLQWTDPASARALLFTLRRLRHDTVLAVLAARPGAAVALGEGWRKLLEQAQGSSHLVLGGFSVEETAQLAAALGRPLSTAGARRLTTHTAGHPLYVRALLEELPEEALGEDVEDLPAPRSLTTTVLGRLAALSKDAQDLVGAAAVLGQRAPLRLAVTLAGLKEGTGAVEEAVASGLVTEEVNSARTEFVFVHPLIHSAIHADLSPTRRRQLHEGVTTLISGPAALSHRVAATTGCDDRLAQELEGAAQEEVLRDATSLATEHLLMAADLSTDAAARERRFLAAVLLMMLGGQDARVRAVLPIIETCADGAARSLVPGVLAQRRGDLTEAERCFVTGSAWDPATPTPYRSWCWVSLAGVELLHGDPEAAARHAEEAARYPGDDPRLTMFTRIRLATALATSGRFEEGLEALGTPPVRAGMSRSMRANLLSEQGMLRLWQNDVVGAIEDLTTALSWSHSGQPVQNPAALYGSLADAEYRAGHWDEALVHAGVAVSLAHDLDFIYELPMVHAVGAYLFAGRGGLDRALDHVGQAEAAARVAPSAKANLFCGLAAGTVAQARGDYPGVLDALDSKLDGSTVRYLDQMVVLPWRLLEAEALIRTEQLERAEAAVGHLEQQGTSSGVEATRLHALRLRGALCAARQDHDGAEATLSQASALTTPIALPLPTALIELARGQSLRRAGGRRRAVGQLQAARDRFAAMGARRLAGICDDELGACGVSRIAGAPGTAVLTPREESVARLVAGGLSNAEAAAQLYVSAKTVEYHLGNVFSKLQITSRRQLATALKPSLVGAGTDPQGQPGT